MSKHGILIGTIAITIVYVIGVLVLHNWGGENEVVSYVKSKDLNLVGDFLAGAFSPLAFLWLTATVLIQSKELSLQREEMKENRVVMKDQADEARKQAEFLGAQTVAMQKQTELLTEQQKATSDATARNYKLSLFEKRFDIYKRVETEADYIEVNGPRNNSEMVFQILSIESLFVFSEEISRYLAQVSRILSTLHILERQADRVRLAEEGLTDEEKQEKLASLSDRRSSNYKRMRQLIKTETRVRRFNDYLNVTDKPERTTRINTVSAEFDSHDTVEER